MEKKTIFVDHGEKDQWQQRGNRQWNNFANPIANQNQYNIATSCFLEENDMSEIEDSEDEGVLKSYE